MTGRRSSGSSIGVALAAAALVCAVVITVLIPAAGVIAECVRPSMGAGHVEPVVVTSKDQIGSLAGSLGRTVVYGGGIGVLAAALALPWAWAMRGGGRGRWGSLAVVPLLLPSYLAYAAISLLRAPGSRLATRLAEMPPDVSVFVGKFMAAAGLSLWAWPIAAMVLRVGASRVTRGAMESAALDGAGRRARAGMAANLMAPAIALAVGAVGLVMMGSAVPLHVAQVMTYTIRLWLVMSLTDNPREIWGLALPLLAIAAAAGTVLTTLVLRPARGGR